MGVQHKTGYAVVPTASVRGIDISCLTETPMVLVQFTNFADAVNFVRLLRQAQLDAIALAKREGPTIKDLREIEEEEGKAS